MKDGRQILALIGNPNSGKSSLFNILTGLRQHIANFPGVTVDKKIGVAIFKKQKVDLIDFPGTYSLYPNSSDEKIVVNILANPKDQDHPDLIIYVADINNLERHLLLATQIIDLGIPMILTLNMIDLADSKEINTKALAKQLNIPIVLTSSREGTGIDDLRNKISQFLDEGKDAFVNTKSYYKIGGKDAVAVKGILTEFPELNPYEAKLAAHHHDWMQHLSAADRITIKSIAGAAGFENTKSQIQETMQRFGQFGPMVSKTLKSKYLKAESFSERIDSLITHRLLGPIIFFTIMFFVFQAIFSWSGIPMDFIDSTFAHLNGFVKAQLPDAWYTSLISDGLISGLGGILIFIPQIAILFLLIAILEEMGYMSRAVFMFDGIMKKFGLNGRSIVALVSSGACAIPAIMSTRTISNWKERLITIMVAPLISCSARIPVYAILVGFVVAPYSVWGIFNSQGLVFMGLYLLSIVAALISALVFKMVLKSDESSYLMIELPHYKKPMWSNVWMTVWEKTKTFVLEAGKVILVISVVLWFLASYGPSTKMAEAELSAVEKATQLKLDQNAKENLIASYRIESSWAGHMGKFIEPAIRPLGFDWKMGIALITSFAAREVFVGTMATIYSIGSADDEATIKQRMAAEINPHTGRPVYDLATSLSLLIFYVFAMQCMSTLAVTRRETKSWKWPVIQFTYMTALAYFGSLLVFQLLK